MTVSLAQARQAVGPATGQRVILHEEGYTQHIIDAVVAAAAAQHDLRVLPGMLAGRTAQDTGRNIHNFLRAHIRYVVDKPGIQDIPEPRRMLANGFSDCKGYSIFTSQILRANGIPHALRFVSFQPGPVTHVYTVLADGTPVDACMSRYGSEKPYYAKKDYPMTQIALISGIGSTITQGEAYARLTAELAELESRAGIGSVDSMNRRSLVLSIEDDFSKMKNPLFANVVTPAEQEVAKATLQNVREGAPYFLYLFVTDPEAIKALPLDAQAQRSEAAKTARFLTESLGLSQNVFMKTVRLGIMQQTGASPEQILAASIPAQVAGIGVLPLIPLAIKAASAIGPVAQKAIPFIRNAVNKVKTALPNAAANAGAAPVPGQAPKPLQQLGQNIKARIQPLVQNLTQSGKTGSAPGSVTPGAPVPAAADTAPPQLSPAAAGGGGLPSWALPVGAAALAIGFFAFGGKKGRR